MEISVVINTLNEEKNLPFALESVKSWASEIIVVDMYSDDATVDIAKSYGAKVYFHEKLGFPDPARAFAVSKSTCEWILILDADELIPMELYQSLVKFVENDEGDIANIPRRNFLLGKELKFSGWSAVEDRQLRFFHRDSMRITGEIHNFMHPLPGYRVINLDFQRDNGIIHFNYINSSQFIEKLNRYTSIEAKKELDRQTSKYKLLIKVPLELIRRLLFQQAYRDGWQGIAVSFYMTFYRLAVYFKFVELKTIGKEDNIVNTYNSLACKFIKEYGENESDQGIYIVIVNWNRWRMTSDCIESVQAFGGYKEIVVVDNGSTDGSFEMLKSIYPNINILRSNDNLGFGAGNNIGIDYALKEGAKYIWLLNNDTIVFEDTLKNLEYCLINSDAGAVSSALYSDIECKEIQSIGAGHINLLGLSNEITSFKKIGDRDYLCAASMMIKSEVIKRVGSFDEAFFLYWEDVDLSFRIYRAGWSLSTCSESKVFHRESATLGKKSEKTKRYFRDSAEIFYKKYYKLNLLYIVNSRIRYRLGGLIRSLHSLGDK